MTEAFDIFVRILEHAGCKPRGNGLSRMAQCPAHKDSSPSMSVRCAGDGRVLVHCFAGCDTQSILDALGVTWKVLFCDDGWPEGGVLHYYKPDPVALGILSDALGAPVVREPEKPQAIQKRPARMVMPSLKPRRLRA